MWKLIKWIIITCIIAGVFFTITGYKIHGKTVQQYLAPILESNMVKEGISDIRSVVGEGLKAAGDAISEDVTDSDRKQMQKVITNEIKTGHPIDGSSKQEALPPKIVPHK